MIVKTMVCVGIALAIYGVTKARAQSAPCVHYYGSPPPPCAQPALPPRNMGATCLPVPNTRIPYYRCSNGYEWWVNEDGSVVTQTVADVPEYDKGSTTTGKGHVEAPAPVMPELNEWTGTPSAYPPMQQGPLR